MKNIENIREIINKKAKKRAEEQVQILIDAIHDNDEILNLLNNF